MISPFPPNSRIYCQYYFAIYHLLYCIFTPLPCTTPLQENKEPGLHILDTWGAQETDPYLTVHQSSPVSKLHPCTQSFQSAFSASLSKISNRYSKRLQEAGQRPKQTEKKELRNNRKNSRSRRKLQKELAWIPSRKKWCFTHETRTLREERTPGHKNVIAGKQAFNGGIRIYSQISQRLVQKHKVVDNKGKNTRKIRE